MRLMIPVMQPAFPVTEGPNTEVENTCDDSY